MHSLYSLYLVSRNYPHKKNVCHKNRVNLATHHWFIKNEEGNVTNAQQMAAKRWW